MSRARWSRPGRQLLATRVDFARLNHLFLPATKGGRDRLRSSAVGRAFRPVIYLYEALTPEGGVFAVVAIVAGAFGLNAVSTETHVLWSALTALLVCSLACARAYTLTDVRLDVVAPKRVALGDEITFTLVVTNDGERHHEALRFAGPFLPWDGAWKGDAPALSALAPGELARVDMRATFRARGEHHLDPFRAAALVPFGLAVGRSLASNGSRFLVVPRVARVVRLTVPPSRRELSAGSPVAATRGVSMDLLGVRPYRPGDPVRDLHARSSARVGAPVVREFQDAQRKRFVVVLDTDAPRGDDGALDAALSLAAGIVAHAARGDACVDGILAGGVFHGLARGGGEASLAEALDVLACLPTGPRFDGDALVRAVAPRLAGVSFVVFVALRWDDARRRAFDRVRASGVAALAVVLAHDGDEPAEVGVVGVPREAVLRGEALAL